MLDAMNGGAPLCQSLTLAFTFLTTALWQRRRVADLGRSTAQMVKNAPAALYQTTAFTLRTLQNQVMRHQAPQSLSEYCIYPISKLLGIPYDALPAPVNLARGVIQFNVATIKQNVGHTFIHSFAARALYDHYLKDNLPEDFKSAASETVCGNIPVLSETYCHQKSSATTHFFHNSAEFTAAAIEVVAPPIGHFVGRILGTAGGYFSTTAKDQFNGVYDSAQEGVTQGWKSIKNFFGFKTTDNSNEGTSSDFAQDGFNTPHYQRKETKSETPKAEAPPPPVFKEAQEKVHQKAQEAYKSAYEQAQSEFNTFFGSDQTANSFEQTFQSDDTINIGRTEQTSSEAPSEGSDFMALAIIASGISLAFVAKAKIPQMIENFRKETEESEAS